MEYVGRRVNKEFQGRGTLSGEVQAYEPANGYFKIVYDVGDSEELRLSELHSVLEPPQQQPEFSALEGEQNKRRRVVDNGNRGQVNDNSVTASGNCCDLVGEGGVSGEFDLDLNAGVDLNEDGFCCLNDDNSVVGGDQGGNEVGGGGKLHGLDLNEGVDFELEGVDGNKRVVIEESSGVKKELIDLNLDVNEDFENLGGEERGRGFDLNLESMEDDIRILADCEGRFGAGEMVSAQGDVQMRGELEDENKEVLANMDDEQGNEISSMKNKEEDLLKNWVSGVENEDVDTVSTSRKRRGRKRKHALTNGVELDRAKTVKVDVEAMNIKLEPESRDATPLKNNKELFDDANRILGSASKARSGRKRRQLLENNINLPTPETGLRRSSRTAKRVALPSQDHVLNAAGMDCINDQLCSPAVSAGSDEMLMGEGHGKSAEHVTLPQKVEFPPSSSNLDLSGVPVFNFVSVYAFLRSFSTLLFLSPFELDDFLASVVCNDSTLLFDSIHVSLLRMIRKHLESLSAEGSISASECLRSLNWDFLDLITWPMYVVEYLLLHSPRYIPGLDLCQLEPFQNNYYKLPVLAKVEILRHLCDDVIEAEAFRLEMNRRTLATEQRSDFERNIKFDSSRKRKAVIGVASTSCITEEDVDEPADWNSDECCLCKMEGNLICCDGCPAAFHSRCVGVVSSLLPEGDWFCPECVIQRDRPWMKLGASIRGAELLGIDPYGRLYYSSCDFLLVLESPDDDYSCRSYKRNDLPGLVEALGSSPFLYDTIITAICKHWNVVQPGAGTRNDLDSRSYSIQSAFPEKRNLVYMHPTPSEILNKDAAVAEKRSGENTFMPTCSRNLEPKNTKHVKLLETGDHVVPMDNQVASSEGSAEVSQAFSKTDTLKEIRLDCSETCPEIPDCSQITLNVEQGNTLNSANDSFAPSAINSSESVSQVHCAIKYVNCYEFARTASSAFEELAYKSSDRISEGAPRSVEETIAGQVKVVLNRFAEFSWSNVQNLTANCRKEKCGWCFYCKVPEEEMDCLFIMNNSIPAAHNFSSDILGIRLRTDKGNHLIDIMCHMICIEDHLQGLLVGQWLNPQYSSLWRKTIVGVSGIASLKKMLLKLESNLHHRVLSPDWQKHVDPVATMGSASHIVSSSARAASKHGIGRKRAKCSELGITPSSNSATGLSLFWWRGGRISRKLFNWKVLPRSLASKAARQGGHKKIPGVLYPESGEYAKRTKCASWRAAVETSRSVEQLALQIRELDANIRWGEIGNSDLLWKMDKESQKSVRSFKKVIIRKKCSEGTVVRYLLDFGKRRFIPDVVKHGSMHEDSSKERKKYWLEEAHVPLYLLKAFEERRIARKSNKMDSKEVSEISRVMSEPFKKKGFAYLFSKAERSENYQCGHCNKDVLIREAVSCQYCKGFFHKRHVRKSDGSIPAECVYTCHKCWSGKLVKINERKRKLEAPKRMNATKKLKHFRSGKGKKSGKAKQPVNSKYKKRVTVVVPLRRSARNAERISKLSLQNTKAKKRKRGKQSKSRKDRLKMFDDVNWQKKGKRTPLNSSYWLNGLRFSRRPDDERFMHFRSRKLLVISGMVSSLDEEPKCGLCGELEYASNLNYVACEICGVWFHGDALDLRADKILNLIGIKCHKCLNKGPPVCPHHSPAESNEDEIISENNIQIQ